MEKFIFDETNLYKALVKCLGLLKIDLKDNIRLQDGGFNCKSLIESSKEDIETIEALKNFVLRHYDIKIEGK